ncbi:MAG: hypothetical protein H9533_01645 [Rhodobacteraceae bacterium]|nr:hypothetical protein [Paracoccaceae bacterium]
MEREEEKRRTRLTIGADQQEIEIEPVPVRVHQTWREKLESFGWQVLAAVVGSAIVAVGAIIFARI